MRLSESYYILAKTSESFNNNTTYISWEEVGNCLSFSEAVELSKKFNHSEIRKESDGRKI